MIDDSYLIGRQPILNRDGAIVAYELLFRSAGSLVAVIENASQATASVIVNTMTAFGLEAILGKHKGYINLDLELLMSDSLNLLPKEQIVIELLETVEVTPDLIGRCRFLKESGFTLALDDHEYDPKFHELYGIADIVKVDLIQTPSVRLEEMIKQLRCYPLQLLAEKVETQDEFRRCLELGFDMFQGYYFAKPSIIEKRRLDESGYIMLKLMQLLNDDADVEEIEKIIRESTGLTYKLLLLVNSVGGGSRNSIKTVRHAITLIGRQQVKRWVQLALFADNDQCGMENPLVEMAAVRATFMENLARQNKIWNLTHDFAEKAFMTGILSILGEIYDIPMDELLQRLNLSKDVCDALVTRSGKLGRLLHVAELQEMMAHDHTVRHLDEIGVSIMDVIESQQRAYSWRGSMN